MISSTVIRRRKARRERFTTFDSLFRSVYVSVTTGPPTLEYSENFRLQWVTGGTTFDITFSFLLSVVFVADVHLAVSVLFISTLKETEDEGKIRHFTSNKG